MTNLYVHQEGVEKKNTTVVRLQASSSYFIVSRIHGYSEGLESDSISFRLQDDLVLLNFSPSDRVYNLDLMYHSSLYI